ncbi:whirlin isoform X1 [Phasianus colchicus]|uniref:whirlin isoform X1 n=1 Tax=Phasianus colchicus TaxID=9054 RepID=UPI00129E3DDE|nr:whirlin isoform X1 [Phasianus colchicus]XP_031457432.1 whirlin isoform X1 [Phasianus colchicus]XP_031457433.1 whirlin isoform X1 [Phasianus colchicus]
MGSSSPWLRWTQSELGSQEPKCWEEEEEEEDFEKHMDENGVIGLGAATAELSDPQDSGSEWGQEAAGSPTWGDGEDLDVGSPAEPRWYAQQDLTEEEEEEEEEEQGSSEEDERPEEPWGTESDGDPHAETPLKALGTTTDGGGTSGPSDSSPIPMTPPRQRRGWGESRDPKQSPQTLQQPKPSRLSPSPRHRINTKKLKDPTDICPYGRGRLNHPLPDLSKVEARVKVGQNYRPPPSRALPARARPHGGPLVPKSPAEIVREVLLSSGEGAPPRPSAPPGVPQELRSPRQATALVQQLQDDYHKLLTKYAEAENTIDQLRLGAKVNLYADPPCASRSAHAGTMSGGCRVMAFSIPRPSAAAISTAPNPQLPVGGAPARQPAKQGAASQPCSPRSPLGGCPTCVGPCCCAGPRLTQTLAEQTRKFQAQVDSFEAWIRAGSSVPQQLLQQRFQRLQDTQDALERAYLEAREEQSLGDMGNFDPERTVEGDIFCLGMRLEELKERLERAAPWSPAVTEGPPSTGKTAGDSEVVTVGLPQPLQHKQLQAEEDFGDLLQQYQHLKSLPASLSLEQLSLTGSAALEEAGGTVAGDSGPGGVLSGTQSLEEGTDLETSPSPPPQRKAVPLPHTEPPHPQGTHGRLSPVTTPLPPSTSRLPLAFPEPLPSRTAPSRCSSGTGSTAPQRRALKLCHQEQRMVSPETDSGFVGSESSRVSLLARTPEHRPLGTGTHGVLEPPVPTPLHPQKKEAPLLPPRKALRGPYPATEHAPPPGHSVPPSIPSLSSSPLRWAGSQGSELGPEGDGARSDSEGGDRSCTSGHPTGGTPASPSPAPAHCDLLGSRMERDQAIRALQDEVWRLRLRLEESLHRSHSYPEGRAPHTPKGRRQPAASRASFLRDAAPMGERSPTARGRMTPGGPRGRWASLPRDGTPADFTSQSDRSLRAHGDSRPRAAPSAHKRPRSPLGAMSLRGQQAAERREPDQLDNAHGRTDTAIGGTHYRVAPPRGEPSAAPCPRCHPDGTTTGAPSVDATRPQCSSTSRTPERCPTCRASRGDTDRAGHAQRSKSDGKSPPEPRSRPQAVQPERPAGCWYLAGGPPVTYLAPVPVVPYAPSLLYCPPAAPTSTPHHTRSPPLSDLEEDLDLSLSTAMAAARRARVTSRRLGQVLAAELGRARAVRSSCLF